MTRLVAPDGPNGADAPTLDKWGEDSGVRSLPARHSLKCFKRNTGAAIANQLRDSAKPKTAKPRNTRCEAYRSA
jgi:hypothetical protein